MNDYYALLGVSRTATPEEIKKAYRRKARELHPDVAETGDEETFKTLTRAYEVLGDAENRRMYDMGVDPTEPRGGGGNPFAGGNPFGAGSPFGSGSFGGSPFGGAGGTFGFQDIFDTFFQGAGAGGGAAGARGRGPIPRKQRGDDALLPITITLADAVFGAKREIEVDTAITCPLCHGSGAEPGSEPVTCETCHGSGHVQRVQRSFLGQVLTTGLCPDCQGHGTIIEHPCPECHGEGAEREPHTITVNIPAGVGDGTRIRLGGYGDAGPGGGPAGDLYVQVTVAPDARFTRNGANLEATIEVPMASAALGTAYRLNTLDGLREVHIEPGTQPGDVLTLKGLGAHRLHGTGRGDLLVTVRVTVPTALTSEQRSLLEQLSASLGDEQLPLPEPPPLGRPAGSAGLFGNRKPKRRNKKRK